MDCSLNKSLRVIYTTTVAIISCVIITCNALKTHENLCKRKCSSPMSNTSYMVEWCDSQDFSLSGRCCMNGTAAYSNDSVVGISLDGCHVSKLSGILTDYRNLRVVLLEDNPLTNHTSTSDDYWGLTNLEYVSLPPHVVCPGTDDAWYFVEYDVNRTICENRTDSCLINNFTCPDNSACTDMGPGVRECRCTATHHGYKCLRTGSFPTVLFSATTAVLTVLISILLWCTQRRYVKAD